MVVNPATAPEAHVVAEQVRAEWVVSITGTVEKRPEGTENPQLATGDVEVHASGTEVLNPSKTPPFYINEEQEVDEALRLSHRYLDLRREGMHGNLVLRHRVVKFIRDFLDERGSWRLRRRYSSRALRRGRGTTWCRAGCITVASTRFRSHRSS